MQVLRQLGDRYPELQPILDKGVAVAIDGQLYRNAQLQQVPEGAEVYLMPRVAGADPDGPCSEGSSSAHPNCAPDLIRGP